MARRPGLAGYGELKKGDTSKAPVVGEGFLPEQITGGFGIFSGIDSVILDGFFAVGGQFPEIITEGFGGWGSLGSVVCDGLFHRSLPAVGGRVTSWIEGAELFDEGTSGFLF